MFEKRVPVMKHMHLGHRPTISVGLPTVHIVPIMKQAVTGTNGLTDSVKDSILPVFC